MSAEQFRDARVFAGFTRPQAAEFLGVSLRSIGHWETGAARAPYAAFKLLRVYRHGDLIDPRWSGFRLVRGKLVTPENHELAPSDMTWLSLTVRRGHAMSELLAQREGRRAEADVRAAAGGPAVRGPTGQPQRLLPLSLEQQTGVAWGCTDGGAVPRVDPAAIAPVDQSVRLPPSNRGVSEFRNGRGGSQSGQFRPLKPKADSPRLSQPGAPKSCKSAQAAPREALGQVARARSGGAL